MPSPNPAPLLSSTHIAPRRWSPPYDPEKPACPYQVGFAVEIKRHTAPLPFDDCYYGSRAWQEPRARRDVDPFSAAQTEVGANVFELSSDGKHSFQLAALPENPMQLFLETDFAAFEGWTPLECSGNARLRQRWLKERFVGEAASQYAPVRDNLNFHPCDRKFISHQSQAIADYQVRSLTTLS
ncbi:hypothetical protein C8A03DRAFT_37710 [Achaetomium macrosporum]|uniref:Uncharacterized protein n=1 Tax=Achaetomium macrosporum TaxID=79813 RepID=A0AAN7HAW8_9PEZI|nr:hypothetical protein C8A03DRAFT_37710 [Achaetomium macrosporum]